MYLPDKLGESAKIDFKKSSSLKKYCPNGNCDTNLDKIKAGFLWLFEKNCSKYEITDEDGQGGTHENTCYNEKNINAIFLYIISWLSYKLNQSSEHNFTKIKDFYNAYVNDNTEYNDLITNAQKCTNLKEIIDQKSDLLDINIKDMSDFYDAFKSLCNMYNSVATSKHDTLLDNAINFFNEYTEINDYYNIENSPYSQILSFLSTDYNTFTTKNASKIDNSKKFPILPTEKATKSLIRHSSIQISVIPMTFIFVALLIYLGIMYKASKTQFKNQKNKKENNSLIYDSKSSDYFRNSNND
ncbi:putative yir1 protein [Plasmodium yoelii yoelii]|nr:putative yir1 protein [Plasmodium yoelii yoelii]